MPRSPHEILTLTALVFSAYPIAAILWLLVTWCVAGAYLGHSPRPFLDDPKSIDGSVFAVHYVVSELALVCALPVLAANAIYAVLAVVSTLRNREPLFHRILLPAAVPAVTWTLGAVLVKWDPLDIITWLFD